jgi:hypothetical protein
MDISLFLNSNGTYFFKRLTFTSQFSIIGYSYLNGIYSSGGYTNYLDNQYVIQLIYSDVYFSFIKAPFDDYLNYLVFSREFTNTELLG